MHTWEERIEIVKEACDIKNNRQLEEVLGLANGYINDLIRGKNKNPAKITAAMVNILKVNPVWFYDESVGVFGQHTDSMDQITMDIKENIRFLDSLDHRIITLVKKHLITPIEDRISDIEKRIDKRLEGNKEG